MTAALLWRSGRHPPGPGVCDRCGRPCPYAAVVPVDREGEVLLEEHPDVEGVEWICETCICPD